MKKTIVLLFSFLLIMASAHLLLGQSAPQVFKYQGVARTLTGATLYNQNLNIKAGIHKGNGSGMLVWEETFATTTDADGLYICMIGTGTTTGAGSLSAFNLIQWQDTSYCLSIAVDFGSGYTPAGNAPLLSVPYSFYSNNAKSITGLSMDSLTDADTTGIAIGYILKWNGINWVPAIDNHHDTVPWANNFIYNNWHLAGNAAVAGNFLGTVNANPLIFKTNTTEQMRITANDQWAAGTTSPLTKTHFVGNDGFQAWGADTLVGSLCDSSAGTRFIWYPRKAALRIGQVTNNSLWGDSKTGTHSFAEGYNCQASGRYSVSMGYNNVANGRNSICIGRNNYASVDSGQTDNGGLICIGDGNFIDITRSIAIGYHNRAEGGISIGYHNRTRTGSSSAAFGKDNTADGTVSMAWGTKASSATKKGCFIFADATGAVLYNTAVNQFMARASGGVIFYTDSTQTNSVQLFAGAGSWASVSDKRKKDNFKEVNIQEILSQISQLEITKWNYITQSRRIHHIGPMAQDFSAAFKIGESKCGITTTDIDGVCLAGIKALEQTTRELAEKLNELEAMKTDLKLNADFDSLESRLDKIEQTINNK